MSGVQRTDVRLSRGITLVVLREGEATAFRLLAYIDGRLTFKTPPLGLTEGQCRAIELEQDTSFDLGHAKLTEPVRVLLYRGKLYVHFQGVQGEGPTAALKRPEPSTLDRSDVRTAGKHDPIDSDK
ncbi:hypothetical protein EON81_01765 [bacterium]|nr:MAG: hypothetical protein EON81_01765 [bacterium]